jgi:hypothetical protein
MQHSPRRYISTYDAASPSQVHCKSQLASFRHAQDKCSTRRTVARFHTVYSISDSGRSAASRVAVIVEKVQTVVGAVGPDNARSQLAAVLGRRFPVDRFDPRDVQRITIDPVSGELLAGLGHGLIWENYTNWSGAADNAKQFVPPSRSFGWFALIYGPGDGTIRRPITENRRNTPDSPRRLANRRGLRWLSPSST